MKNSRRRCGRITNSLQMRKLAQLRNTLLPRLISGKLRLPDVVEPACVVVET